MKKKVFIGLGTTFFVFLCIICILLSSLLESFISSTHSFQVIGHSMSPTLKNQAYIFGFSNNFNDLERSDLVVYESPKGYPYVGRIVGLPGESIQILEGNVYVDGGELHEPYLNQETYTESGDMFEDNALLVVPNSTFFILGDNRTDSLDSRFFEHGFVEQSKLIMSVEYSFPPLRKI